MGGQKSAEAIVVRCIAGATRLTGDEGPNLLSFFGAKCSMSETDADLMAEMLEQRPKVGDGITEGTPAARQADTAHDEHAEDQIPVTLEKALSRENMWRAYERVVGNQVLRASTAPLSMN